MRVKDVSSHEEESKWVRKMFDWYDNGKSSKWIGEQLDSNGIKPRRSKIWSLGSIQNILKNDLYIGRDEMTDSISKKYRRNPKKYITKTIDYELLIMRFIIDV